MTNTLRRVGHERTGRRGNAATRSTKFDVFEAEMRVQEGS